MGETQIPMHFVSTISEAESLINKQQSFWVSNCGCRERKGSCSQSRMDVCLLFSETVQSSGSGKKEITREDVNAILNDARNENLVARPFRNEDRTSTEGICFCCNDCCEYFRNPSEACDKGTFIEKTDTDSCSDCGVCADVCYFNARLIEDDKLSVITENCYGCGLCVDICPEACIEMISRLN